MCCTTHGTSSYVGCPLAMIATIEACWSNREHKVLNNSMYMYIYICMCVYTYIYMYMYIHNSMTITIVYRRRWVVDPELQAVITPIHIVMLVLWCQSRSTHTVGCWQQAPNHHIRQTNISAHIVRRFTKRCLQHNAYDDCECGCGTCMHEWDDCGGCVLLNVLIVLMCVMGRTCLWTIVVVWRWCNVDATVVCVLFL